jgi:hypothetical protein
MLSGVPQGSTLGHLLFNIFNNNLCSNFHFCCFLLFADDFKIFPNIKSAEDCKLLHSDIGSVQNWYIENCMKISIFKTSIICFTRKIASVNFNHFLCDLLIIWTGCANILELCCI